MSTTGLAKLRNSLERRELEQVELKKDLKQAEKNADESKAVRQDLETELANLRNSLALARREISIFRTDGPALSLDKPMIFQRGPIQNGNYGIKRARGAADIYWSTSRNPITTVGVGNYILPAKELQGCKTLDLKVNNHSPIIHVSSG